ncbi:hypothetical protein HPB49_010332 [Dermacentor silvarum]|uniref:Uncharacterized protein n=1 Tax=Dermacentor silvarum TaxID=543639 RepID=A0ACB8CEG5_DERSI|nr:hypothetical protein HPB49_010332 [Dermacentor silvarum]
MASDRVYRDVSGLHLSCIFQEAVVKEALTYKAKPGDVFVVSFPKSGSTWMQQIVYAIYHDGSKAESLRDFLQKSPVLELVGLEAVQNMPRPGAIKTHLPFNRVPYSPQAKYIFVARNPYDCCVSFYYHTRAFPAYRFADGSFEKFLSAAIIKIADFLGDKYGKKLRKQSEVLERILYTISVKTMMEFNGPGQGEGATAVQKGEDVASLDTKPGVCLGHQSSAHWKDSLPGGRVGSPGRTGQGSTMVQPATLEVRRTGAARNARGVAAILAQQPPQKSLGSPDCTLAGTASRDDRQPGSVMNTNHVYRDVCGINFCWAFQEHIIREALAYKPRQGDLFVVSYPKCGTTWMQHIVYAIFNDGTVTQGEQDTQPLVWARGECGYSGLALVL